jgi:beta-fructofuranosidase
MSVLEARQNEDGTLAFGFADELVESFWDDVPVSFERPLPAGLHVPDGYAALVSHEDMPGQFYAKAAFRVDAGTSECGLLLRSSHDGDESYVVRLEPKRGRLVFDRWPRQSTGAGQWEISGDVPFEIELERPCQLPPGEHTLEVIVDADLCVAVVDRKVALSTRIYDRKEGRLGVFVGEGSAVVESLHVRKRTNN